MADDWIQMRVALPDDPDVIAIAAALNSEEYSVCGMLLRFWGWADQHTADGNAPSVTCNWIDRYIGVTGFSSALIDRGWLEVVGCGIRIPGFDRFLGKSGKKRLQTAKRVANHRRVKRECNAPSVTETVTREEKRREEEEPKGSSTSQTKSATSKYQFSEWDRAFAERMHADILVSVPSAKAPSFDSWANDLRLLRESDDRSNADIEALWQFANGDDFWRSNILSPRKLREKWTQLAAKRAATQRGSPARQAPDKFQGNREFVERFRNNAPGSIQPVDGAIDGGGRKALLG